MPNRWTDISVPIRHGMVRWPRDPAVEVTMVRDMAAGDRCTVSRLSMGSHTGTHMDAPAHFLRGARTIDHMPIDATMGPARVLAIRHPQLVTAEELRRHRIRRGERILLKTRNSVRCWRTRRFVEDFVYLANDAARLLADRRVRAVGIDYLSVGGYRERNGDVVHRTLLRAGVWIIEGLNLARVPAGSYEMICLPLKIFKGDGAPARAALRRRG